MTINAERLWSREMELGNIGAVKEGGVSRFAWTDAYREAAELLMRWMTELGMSVRVDSVGNVFGRMEGSEDWLSPVLTGSHLDTVPRGGCFDGVAGIMGALEAVATMRERGERPRRPIEIVAFINEEASQFLGGCFGSKAMCGMIDSDYADRCLERNTGRPLREAMLHYGMGVDPDGIEKSALKPGDYHAFLEMHIEQGRYLLDRGFPLAVVSGIAGIKQFYITFNGVSCHAGGMAMEDRHDAMAAAVAAACELERLALHSGSDTRATVGYIHSEPGEQNIVASRAVMSVDYREENDEIWRAIYDELMMFVRDQCNKRGLSWSVHMTIDTPPAHCDTGLSEVIDRCAAKAGIEHCHMVSFPAHDAMQLSRLFPMAMIFLRSSHDGRSHCPEEYTTPEDLAAGTEVLYQTLKEIAW